MYNASFHSGVINWLHKTLLLPINIVIFVGDAWDVAAPSVHRLGSFCVSLCFSLNNSDCSPGPNIPKKLILGLRIVLG